jgi:predicted amidophosphoribosyltransferase
MHQTALTTHALKSGLIAAGHSLMEYLWPTRCAGCERLGSLLCEDCRAALPFIDQELACQRCGAPLGRLICTECQDAYRPTSFAFSQACCALELTPLSRRLIVNYKDGNERRLAPLLAQLIMTALPQEWRRWTDIISWVPADSRALRRRGFDHLALVADSLSQQAGRTAWPLLVKRSGSDQRLLDRGQRAQNAAKLFAVNQTALRQLQAANSRRGIKGQNILLLDDILTTGATLQAASLALLAAGAGELRVATVCRVW